MGWWETIVAPALVGAFAGWFLAKLDYWLTQGRAEKRRQGALVTLLRMDIEDNSRLAASIHRDMNAELQVLSSQQTLVAPTAKLRTSTMETLRGDLPAGLQNANALQAFRNVLNRYYEINETLDSREQWRQNHQAMSNFEPRLEKLDQVVIVQVERLDREIRELRHFGLGEDIPLEGAFQEQRS